MVDHLEQELDKLIAAIASSRQRSGAAGVKRCIQLISVEGEGAEKENVQPTAEDAVKNE